MRLAFLRRHRQLFAFVGLALAVAYVLYVQSGTTRAVCAFRGDLESRVARTAAYLDTHPGPEPIPGVPRAVLRSQLDNQQQTLDSLKIADHPWERGLHCSDPPEIAP